MEPIKNRYEFTLFFDVVNGNPNGDPDAGNLPRVDPETSFGIVTDVCIKHKVRNFVEVCMDDAKGYEILIKPDQALNEKYEEAYAEVGNDKEKKKAKKNDPVSVKKAQQFMCEKYFDVRTFGAVMSTGDSSCGKVTGPVQFAFAQSVDRVYPTEITVTRQAVTTVEDMENKENTLGKKCYIPYGLYRIDGYVSAYLAKKTGFSEDDLELLWSALINMFEHDHSAARGKMTVRKMFIFKHDSMLGNAPSHILFEKIDAIKKNDKEPARSFKDYGIAIDRNMPCGVQLIEKF